MSDRPRASTKLSVFAEPVKVAVGRGIWGEPMVELYVVTKEDARFHFRLTHEQGAKLCTDLAQAMHPAETIGPINV